ncbi:FG-GAP repeat domain-containing protein [Streptomyces coelicoflavus]|uniref:FG-GAP-like repeat-containing protein n=1 Tax=Streptomyces TaxID=1883 RepID=UPI001291E750|nr:MULTISPECIES: FG-GAP-like repeat-containing protein [Streptomyces]MCX5036526.1 VCBS repeat-containing protein [Streptomyces coelicoflavus]QFX82731.1 VCBS repeat-containing protein [Streptomyces sp. SYP-A7193]
MAIAAVLATVSAGGQAVAAPATAPLSTPSSASAATAASATAVQDVRQAAVPYPAGRSQLAGVGSTGFLTWGEGGAADVLWTSFADGSTTDPMEGRSAWVALGAEASDAVVLLLSDGRVELRDMRTKKSVTVVDPDDFGPSGQSAGAVGTTLFVSTANDAGGEDVHLVDMVDGAPAARTVTGLPRDADNPHVVAGTPDRAVLTYKTAGTWQWALVDLADGAVVRRHTTASAPASVTLSETHVAWAETDAQGGSHVVVAPRGTGTDRRFAIGQASGDVLVGLVGDWVTYGVSSELTAQDPNPLYALTARHLTTGATRKLLDHTRQTATAPDGTLYVSGGTAAGGEGLYRIAPGADGTPVATRVASSGEATKVTLLGDDIPDVVDLDRNKGRFRLEWRLSRVNVAMDITLRNTRTGEVKRADVYPLSTGYGDPHRVHLDWFGDVEWNSTRGMYSAAGAGPYTWRIEARPLNGIGPELVSSGTFTVARDPGLHDYDGDGSPDVLARDTGGRLWLNDTFDSREQHTYSYFQNPEQLVGGGWNAYDRIEGAGNLGGAPVSDLVARDRSGVLWLYLGKGDAESPFTSRSRIGGGWNVYRQITGGSDLNGDGRADLVATDTSGALWLYKGTGNWRAPFAKRVKIGTGGWGAYDRITATGDIAGAPAGDLVARDRSGVLWLYLGYGDGRFAPRTRIGGGWNTYEHLVGIGDADHDGRADLYATDVRPQNQDPYLYKSTGAWRTPFAGRAEVARTFMERRDYNLFA